MRYRPVHRAGYVSGAAGSNDCPAGSTRITDEASCRSAAGKPAAASGFVEMNSISPKGCYYDTNSNNAVLNNDATGAGAPRTQLLCCDGCTPAPTGALPRARAWRSGWLSLALERHRAA